MSTGDTYGAMLFDHKNDALLDAEGEQLRERHRVRDGMFGYGTVEGTCPLQRGVGVNVKITWEEPLDDEKNPKPAERGAEHLRIARWGSISFLFWGGGQPLLRGGL